MTIGFFHCLCASLLFQFPHYCSVLEWTVTEHNVVRCVRFWRWRGFSLEQTLTRGILQSVGYRYSIPLKDRLTQLLNDACVWSFLYPDLEKKKLLVRFCSQPIAANILRFKAMCDMSTTAATASCCIQSVVVKFSGVDGYERKDSKLSTLLVSV